MKTIVQVLGRSKGAIIIAVILGYWCILDSFGAWATDALDYYLSNEIVPINLYMLAAVFFLIPSLVHLDPPLSSDAFISTRPISKKSLFWAKLAIIFTLAVLPQLIRTGLAMHMFTMDAHLIAYALALLFIQLSAFLFPCLLIASWTKKYTEYLIVALASAFIAWTLWYSVHTFGVWTPTAFYRVPSFTELQAIDDMMGRATLYTLIAVASGSGVAYYLVNIRASRWQIGLPIFISACICLFFQVDAVITTRSACARMIAKEVPEQSVSIRSPKISVWQESEGEDTATSPRKSFNAILPTDSPSPETTQHLLRFVELSMSDADGNLVSIKTPDRGTIPCLDDAVIEKFISGIAKREIKLISHQDCELGRDYYLPQEYKIPADSVAELKGQAVGLEYALEANYVVPVFNMMIKPPTMSWPIGVFALPPTGEEDLTDSFMRINQVLLFSPLTSKPLSPRNNLSPLLYHNSAAQNEYVIYNSADGRAARLVYSSWDLLSERVFGELLIKTDNGDLGINYLTENEVMVEELVSSVGKAILAGADNSDTGNETQISKAYLNWILVSIAPRIITGFTAPIEIHNVPIKDYAKHGCTLAGGSQ